VVERITTGDVRMALTLAEHWETTPLKGPGAGGGDGEGGRARGRPVVEGADEGPGA
jgi:hypothetical protein